MARLTVGRAGREWYTRLESAGLVILTPVRWFRGRTRPPTADAGQSPATGTEQPPARVTTPGAPQPPPQGQPGDGRSGSPPGCSASEGDQKGDWGGNR